MQRDLSGVVAILRCSTGGKEVDRIVGAVPKAAIAKKLDAVLAKPLHRLPMVVQMLLRLGAYQLLFLDRIESLSEDLFRRKNVSREA